MDAIKVLLFFSLMLLSQATTSSGQSPMFEEINARLQQTNNRFRTDWAEPFGAEELYDGDDSPRIPEPMVFDLVRPLGARRGEAEINTLAILPLNRRLGDAEWAPEIELAIADGVAVEFELPFDEWSLAAYKTAGQVTFGTAFNNSFIHGAQGILLYDRETGNWAPTLLYLAGVQFDETWSALAMVGLRTEFAGDDRGNRTEKLFNFSLFKHVGDYTTLGIETNTSTSLLGNSEFRLIPQVHHELQDHIMVQLGVGCLFTSEATIPELGTRLIYSF